MANQYGTRGDERCGLGVDCRKFPHSDDERVITVAVVQ